MTHPQSIESMVAERRIRELEAELEQLKHGPDGLSSLKHRVSMYFTMLERAEKELKDARAENERLTAGVQLQSQVQARLEDELATYKASSAQHKAATGRLGSQLDQVKRERNEWRKKWESLEVSRASCCWANEEDAKQARKAFGDAELARSELAAALAAANERAQKLAEAIGDPCLQQCSECYTRLREALAAWGKDRK